jgi:penicillin-binding protein A
MHHVSMFRTRRRTRWRRWAVAAAVVLAAAGGAGAYFLRSTTPTRASQSGPDPLATARTYVRAWQNGDYTTMYGLLSRASHQRVGLTGFERDLRSAAATAGVRSLTVPGAPVMAGASAVCRMVVTSALFGAFDETLRLPLTLAPHGYRVTWSPNLVFPGLLPGERLVRRATAPHTRGRIRARDGTVIASGPAWARVYPLGSAFADVTGYTRPPTPAQAAARVAAGWPPKLVFGQGGLEKSLDAALGGRPQVDLVARSRGSADRLLVRRAGRSPHDVTTTLQVSMQQSASAALAGRYGGVVVLNPRTGAVEADAGLGMDALQPPGSSFKTITASAALTAHVARLTSTYAYAHSVTLDGWTLHNFHHEYCGGSLILAFAQSCNSVFAPIADQVGAKRLVAMASAFGFNTPPTIGYPLPESVTPRASTLTSDLAVGVAGIGQGGVDASPLQMASVAQAIGSHGLLRPPYLIHAPHAYADRAPPRRVLSPLVATQLRTLMEAVVTEGTGTAAALPGVVVAGKTGTSEVGLNTPTDAWFIAFAPADNPRVAVAVLVVGGGVGGVVAAPIAREVMASALGL